MKPLDKLMLRIWNTLAFIIFEESGYKKELQEETRKYINDRIYFNYYGRFNEMEMKGEWFPTPEFRVVEKSVPINPESPHGINKKFMQQLWKRFNGSIDLKHEVITNTVIEAKRNYDNEWRDIPFEQGV